MHLAAARVMQTSGTADIIFEWMDEADADSDASLFSERVFDTLNAKLFLSGRDSFLFFCLIHILSTVLHFSYLNYLDR